jgi:PilZ domain
MGDEDASDTDSDDLLAVVAQLLVDASAVEMVSENGALVEVWTISCEGAAVRASAPRLQIAQDMRLACRLVIAGVPHRVSVIITDAQVHSVKRAALLLDVVEATADGFTRASERVDLAAQATLTAQVCGRLVPGESVSAQIVDLSQTGCGATVADSRPRTGDRMRLYCRFIEGEIDCDARIKTAVSAANGQTRLGFAFIAPSATVESVTTHVLARLNRAPATTQR